MRITVKLLICLLIFTATFIFYCSNNVVFADSQVAYSLVIRNTTPAIKAGETLEIEAFISGYGTPYKNKLNIFWSSPYVIDKNNPGTYEVLGSGPIGIDPNGIKTSFTNDTFSVSKLSQQITDFGLPMIQTETALGGKYPIILNINTAKDAPPGDYDIIFVFTYSDNQSMYQDFKTIPFHIYSYWERNQTWFQIAAVSIALISLVSGAVFSLLTYKKTQKKH